MIAVAVSGGCDSMALLHSLTRATDPKNILAITLDHGLREESSTEAYGVSLYCERIGVKHKILRWEGEKPETRIEETARHVRYRLMADCCKEQNIKQIFVGHHMQDQAETVLMRICSGSGIEGLAAMQERSKYSDDIEIVRPFLKNTKDELRNYCKRNSIPWIEDPSNDSDKFKRNRIRKMLKLLEPEGLSVKRLCVLAERAKRVNDVVESNYKDSHNIYQANGGFTYWIQSLDDEIAIRTLKEMITKANPAAKPRLEQLEGLFYKIKGCSAGKFTLGGCVIEREADYYFGDAVFVKLEKGK